MHLACLVPNGILLANLLNIVKSEGTSSHRKETIHVRVKDIITNLLKVFSEAQDKASFPEESIKKLLAKFEGSLQDFIKYDSVKRSEYELILKEVKDFQYGKQQAASVATTSAALSLQPHLSLKQSQEDLSSPEQIDLKAVYEDLVGFEKQCLACFLLFPAGVEIKKRELIHCWVGMDLIDNPEDGDEILAKLVTEGLIERTFADSKLFNRYKMVGNIQVKLFEQVHNGSVAKDGSWSVLYKKEDQQQSGNSVSRGRPFRSFVRSMTLSFKDEEHHGDERSGGSQEPGQVEALVNLSQNTLTAKRFESLSKMKNLKVLHLGCWQQDPSKYIAVDEIEVFKDLKHVRQLRFLSLEGVSGIVELPDCVYELKYLKVLDLRECHNLEFLPMGIELLQNLTHLDLSQCYLLDHIPFGLTSLIHLQVLKGFVINDNEEHSNQLNNKVKAKVATPCPFRELRELKLIKKLTIRTRRTNFPTGVDLQTLCEMKQLQCLRIAWVKSSNADSTDGSTQAPARPSARHPDHERFPATVTKLELQAAPELTTSWLLRLISNDTNNYCLEKLYIIGGRFQKLERKLSFFHVKVVRLRYLPLLHINWDRFTKMFPNLGRLAILGCPNLIFFPCDENGVWESEFQENPISEITSDKSEVYER